MYSIDKYFSIDVILVMNYFNYFATKTAAERYAAGRPYTHGKAIEEFKKFAKIEKPFKICLDVACGTGQSSVAAAEICEQVIGIDISESMLSQTKPHPKINFQQGNAENLPFENESFDLITVGLALHWFDRPVFMKEAHRVLKTNSWMVLYHNEFSRGIPDIPEFKEWYSTDYLKKFPQPPRKIKAGFEEKLAKNLFDIKGNQEIESKIPMTQSQIIAYIVSQSNVIAAVEQGKESIEEVVKWLTKSTDKFFENSPERIFLFDGKIFYLRKSTVD